MARVRVQRQHNTRKGTDTTFHTKQVGDVVCRSNNTVLLYIQNMGDDGFMTSVVMFMTGREARRMAEALNNAANRTGA